MSLDKKFLFADLLDECPEFSLINRVDVDCPTTGTWRSSMYWCEYEKVYYMCNGNVTGVGPFYVTKTEGKHKDDMMEEILRAYLLQLNMEKEKIERKNKSGSS